MVKNWLFVKCDFIWNSEFCLGVFGELAYVSLIFWYIATLPYTTYRLPDDGAKTPKYVGVIIIQFYAIYIYIYIYVCVCVCVCVY